MCIAGGNLNDLDHSASAWTSAEPGAHRRTAAHQHLFFEGDERTHLYVVESGWAKIYRTLIDGQRQIVGFCSTGAIIGLESSETYVNGCEAVTALSVRAIPVARLGELCTRDPLFAVQLISQLGTQLGAAQAQITSVGAQSADQKLAAFLLAIANASQPPGGDFDLPMRRSEMAEFLGLRLETVSRKMSDFQRRKWLKMNSLYNFRLSNRAALEYLAEGGAIDDADLSHGLQKVA